jgi:hypothetical protein
MIGKKTIINMPLNALASRAFFIVINHAKTGLYYVLRGKHHKQQYIPLIQSEDLQ